MAEEQRPEQRKIERMAADASRCVYARRTATSNPKATPKRVRTN
jgi:hypothetical protein